MNEPLCPVCNTQMKNLKVWHEKVDKFHCPSCNDSLENLQAAATAKNPAPAPATGGTVATPNPDATRAPAVVTINRRGTRDYDPVKYEGPFPVTVRQLFEIYQGRLDLGGQTSTMVNGLMANADTMLKGGEYVTFKDSAKERGF